MDRQIVYPGAIPLDTDLLNAQREAMIAVGYLAQLVLGTAPVVDGLACAPTAPASMSVTVGPGSVTQFGVVDTTSYGSLPAEPTEPLLRMGIILTSTSFALAAPTGSGQAIDYLIEATMVEDDATPVVLPYYNPSNPAQPYSGPGNSGTAQNTQRLQQVQLQLKAGAPGTAGEQQTPPVDQGWSGLYVITVLTGQTEITAGNIEPLPTAPFIYWKLPAMTPGTRNLAVFTPTTQRNWTVPAGVSLIKVRAWGGGGAGGAGFGGAGGGGGGGGYAEGFYSVEPGQTNFVMVGNGGVGSGTPGGPSSFGSITSANGGLAGANGTENQGGAGAAAGGTASGSGLTVPGNAGGSGFIPMPTASFGQGGQGGGAYGGSGAGAAVAAFNNGGGVNGASATTPGGGGAGGVGNGLGGQGGAGLVLVEW
jgi:hypothetical protein